MLAQTAVLAAVAAATALLVSTTSPVRSPALPPAPAASDARAALDDATIIAIFDAANTADIETGALAAERGGSKEVRAFGTMLVHDHQQVRQMGRDLAKKLGVTPTPPADDAGARAHAEAMARLRALSGAQFDRAFLVHEESFHASVIAAVTSTLLPAIKNAELKALVTKVAPAFEGHRRAADEMAKRLAAAKGDR